MNELLDDERRARGEFLVRRANLATEFRAKSAPYLAGVVGLTDENWAVTGVAAAIGATDASDGWDARNGAKLLDTETSPDGAVSDPEADKDYINGMLAGLAMRFLRQRKFGSATVVAGNAAVCRWRDRNIRFDRQMVVQHQLDPSALKAIKINKFKMGLQAGSVIALSSPAAERPGARWSLLGSLTTGTAIGVVGERIYRHRVSSLIASKTISLAVTASNTNEDCEPPKTALPYTSREL